MLILRDEYLIVNDGVKHNAKDFFTQLWKEVQEDLIEQEKQQEIQEAPSES